MATGDLVEESRVRTTREALQARFGGRQRMRIAVEVGPHSPWISRLLEAEGHEVVVANARRVALIYAHSRKSDRVDAETLARLARTDPKLLSPLQHRSEQAQYDLALLRSRDMLVRSRTRLINHVRGICKAAGQRLPRSSSPAFAQKVVESVPAGLASAVEPLLEVLAHLTRQIRGFDRQIEQVAQKRYPVTTVLRQITGVGPLASLAYVLVLEDPTRFRTSRGVGPYLGLVPRRAGSGNADPPLRITKEGDRLLRRLLVHSAQYILGRFGPDCDLRRYGQRIAGSTGNRIAKKKAVVAVARKLAVLLHHLWITAEDYDPLFNQRPRELMAA